MAKAVFISHGGGPLPLLGDPNHQELVACLQKIAAAMPKPKAIVVVSAHWETAVPTITAHPKPSLIYDYYNFPPESYQIQYPCPGSPALAAEIQHCLVAAGLPAQLDAERGLDHGVFVPLKIMYPDADIPCVQLSLLHNLDAQQHLQMGKALATLANPDVLILGSGFSFHNLRAFFSAPNAEQSELNVAFEGWLQHVCTSNELSESEREQALMAWDQAPGARFCHPREEHLLPLHVCYGVAQAACRDWHVITIIGKQSSLCVW